LRSCFGTARVDEALKRCAEVDRLIDAYQHDDASTTSQIFVALERGRCLVARGQALQAAGDVAAASTDLSAAVDAFRQVEAWQSDDGDHPRIAAVRGLVAAQRALGEAEWMDMLDRCLNLAENDNAKPMARKWAAYAAGDVLVAQGAVTFEPRPRVERAWEAQHRQVSSAAISLKGEVY
jgi:hypothetical protein